MGGEIANEKITTRVCLWFCLSFCLSVGRWTDGWVCGWKESGCLECMDVPVRVSVVGIMQVQGSGCRVQGARLYDEWRYEFKGEL